MTWLGKSLGGSGTTFCSSSSLKEVSYIDGDHRARVSRKCCKSASMLRSSRHALMRRSSHVRRIASNSILSERSRKRRSSLSNSRIVVKVNSMRSVSAGERLRWVAAKERRRHRRFSAGTAMNVHYTPFVNFLSLAISPESKISVSFSILSCSCIHRSSSAREGNPATTSADCRTASKPANTSIGGICSRNYEGSR